MEIELQNTVSLGLIAEVFILLLLLLPMNMLTIRLFVSMDDALSLAFSIWIEISSIADEEETCCFSFFFLAIREGCALPPKICLT